MAEAEQKKGSGGFCSSGCAKALMLFAGMGVFAVILFVALMVYGSKSGTAKLTEYFEFATKSSIEELSATFHPNLVKIADPSRLAQLIKAVPAHYGAFKDIEMNGFNFSDKYTNGLRLRDYEGNMVFEKATIPMELNFANDQLLGFRVKDNKDAEPLLKMLTIPEKLDSYRDTSEQFWKTMLTGKVDEAFNLMSEPLQKQLGKDGFALQCKNFQRNGAPKSIVFLKSVKDPESKDKVHFLFKCTLEKAVAVGHVTFQFAGIQSYLIAFQISSPFADK